MAERIKRPSIEGNSDRCCECHQMDEKIKKICKKYCGKCDDCKPPYIGENGNWFVWDGKEFIDSGVSAQGPKGEHGEQGPQGERGDKGDKGDKGDPGDKGNVKAMQMQSQNNKHVSVDYGIPFDSLILDISDGDITYNDTYHYFVVKKGVYLVNWEVFYDLSTTDRAKVTVVYENGYKVVEYGTITQGIICGTALIPASQDTGVISIITDANTVTLADVDVQANIVITKLS